MFCSIHLQNPGVKMANLLHENILHEMPEVMESYRTAQQHLQTDSTGRAGILDVELQADSTGNTVITRQHCQAPLQIQRVLYPETSLPSMAYLYLLSSSGGILQGDRHCTVIALKNNAVAHITTQGATRIYGMNNNYASQAVNIAVQQGSYLEYIPDQMIPYKNSRYHQRVNIQLDEQSTLIYSEILTPGRVAMGESFQYDICYLQTYCQDQDKKIKFLENTKIQPNAHDINAFGILGSHKTMGTVYLLTAKRHLTQLEGAVNKVVNDAVDEIAKTADNTVVFGTSALPNGSGVIVRVLGDKTDDVADVVFKILQVSRKKILGAPCSKIRKS